MADTSEAMHVDVFFGSNNWCGFTPMGIGSDHLPAENGPWTPHGTTWLVSKKHPAQRIVTDLEIIEGIGIVTLRDIIAGVHKSRYYQRQLSDAEIRHLRNILEV
jgi:hypothetical protein